VRKPLPPQRVVGSVAQGRLQFEEETGWQLGESVRLQ